MLQMTPPTSGGAVTIVLASCCANCVETSRLQQWGPYLPFYLGKQAMRTFWMVGTVPHKGE